MTGPLQPIRDLGALLPEVADSARSLQAAAEAAGIKLRPIETRRSQDRQNLLYAQGRTTPGDQVTWTLHSNHTPGAAVDFIANDDMSGRDPGYQWLQENAPQHGFRVLGAKDPGHVEMPSAIPHVGAAEPPSEDPLEQLKALRATAVQGGGPAGSGAAGNSADPLEQLKALRATATLSDRLRAPLAARPASESSATAPNQAMRRVAAAAQPSLIGGLARSAEQGATFGFGDELNAGVRSLFPGQTYSGALQDERTKLHAFQSAHPVVEFGSELGGGLLGGGALGAGARALGVGARAATATEAGSRVLRALKAYGTGATLGGAAAAGSADGDLEDRAKAIPVGMVFGAGTVAGSKLVGSLGRGVRNLLPEPIAQALGKSAPVQAAQQDILKQIDRGGLTINDVQSAAANAAPETMLMDVGGKPLLRRARAAQSLPSTGSNQIEGALSDRIANQPARVQSAAAQAFAGGQPRENAVLSARQLIDQRRANAAPLYDKAYAGPPIEDPDIYGLYKHDQFKDAYTQAQRLATLEENPLPAIFKQSSVGGQLVTEQLPIPIRSLDYTKRGLDAMIESRAGSAQALSKGEARLLRQKLNDALAIADTHSPDYAAARQQFAGDSRLMDAHERGTNFLKESGDELAADFPSMTTGEKELYRRGALSSLGEQLAKVTDGRDVTRIFQNPLMRQKLQTILPDPATATAFARQLSDEAAMHKNAQLVLSGSPTARIAAEQADEGTLSPAAIHAMHAMATGNPTGLLTQGLRAVANKATGLTEARADALAPYLTAKGPALAKALKELDRASQRNPVNAPLSQKTRTLAQIIGGYSQQ